MRYAILFTAIINDNVTVYWQLSQNTLSFIFHNNGHSQYSVHIWAYTINTGHTTGLDALLTSVAKSYF